MPGGKRRRDFKRWRVAALLLVMALLTAVAFRSGAGWPLTRGLANRVLLAPIGCELTGGEVRWSLFPSIQLHAKELSLRGKNWRIALGELHSSLSGWSLARGRLQVEELLIYGLEVSSGGGDGGGGGLPDWPRLQALLARCQCNRIELRDIRFDPAGGPSVELENLQGRLGGEPESSYLELESVHAFFAVDEALSLDVAHLRVSFDETEIQICAEEIALGNERLALRALLRPGPAPSWRAHLDFDDLSLQAIQPLVDSDLTRAQSRLDGSISVRSAESGLAFSGRLSGHVRPIDLHADSVSGYWDGQEIVLTHTRGRVRGMQVEVELAAIDPRTQNYRVECRAKDIDLERDLSFMTETRLAGQLRFQGSHFGGEDFWINLQGEELQGELWGLGLANGALQLRYQGGMLDFDSLDVQWPGARYRGSGRVNLNHSTMRWEGHLSLHHESPFTPHFVPLSDFACSVEADGRLVGPVRTPRLTATYAGTRLQYGALVLDQLRGEVDLDSLFHQPTGLAFLRGEGLLGVLPLRVEDTRLEVHGRDVGLTEMLAHQGRRRIRAAGSLWIEEGVRGDLAELSLDSALGGVVAADTVHFTAGEEGFRLAPVQLLVAGGQAELQGTYAEEPGLGMTLNATNIKLDRLARMGGAPPQWTKGTLDARAEIAGTFANPRINSTLGVTGLVLGPATIGDLRGNVRLEDGALHVQELRAAQGSSLLHVRGEYPLGPQLGWQPVPGREQSIALATEVHDWSLAALGALVGLDSLQGRVDGEVELGGSLESPTLDLNTRVHDLLVLDDPYAAVALAARYEAGELSVDAGDESGSIVRGAIPLRFSLAPIEFRPAAEPLDLDLNLRDFDAAFLRHLIPDVTSARGRLSFTGQLRGHLPWPSAHGELALEDGRVQLIWMNVPLHDLSGRATVEGDRTTLLEGRGRLGAEGQFTAAGKIQTEDFVPVDYDLQLRGQRLPVGWLPDLRAVVDADLRFTRNLHISGDVDVREAIYTRNFGEDPEPLPPPLLPGEEGPMVLSYDLYINGDRNIWLRNAESEMELEGNLHLVSLLEYEELPFMIQGELDVIRGTYTILGKNTFNIDEGEVRMLDPSILDPEIEVEASATLRERVRNTDGSYQSQALPVRLNLRGNFFSDLSYEFTDLGNGEAVIPIEDVVLLLTFGRRRASVEQQGLYDPGTAAADASAITAQLLESRVSELLDISVEIGTGTVSPLESLDETYVGLGKYLNDRLFVYYSQYLSADPRRKLGVEYALTNHVLLGGELDDTDANASHYNVDLRYRLEY